MCVCRYACMCVYHDLPLMKDFPHPSKGWVLIFFYRCIYICIAAKFEKEYYSVRCMPIVGATICFSDIIFLDDEQATHKEHPSYWVGVVERSNLNITLSSVLCCCVYRRSNF